MKTPFTGTFIQKKRYALMKLKSKNKSNDVVFAERRIVHTYMDLGIERLLHYSNMFHLFSIDGSTKLQH